MAESDSSDDEWVITSSTASPKRDPVKSTPTISRPPRSMPIRLSRPLPPRPPKTISQRSDSLTDRDLHIMCTQMDSDMLVSRLINVYKSSETYLSMREAEVKEQTFQWRLTEYLHDCPDPCAFIQCFLLSLGSYFDQHSVSQHLSPKFQRLLAQAACSALSRFLDTKPCFYKHTKAAGSKDLITLDDDESPEPNLISFDDSESEQGEDEGDEDGNEKAEESVAIITLAQLLDVPPEIAERYKLTKTHQVACIDMINSTSTPALVFYAIEVFRLVPLLCLGGEYEQQGVQLCEQLIIHANYNEAISSIRKLDLYSHFPIEQFADRMLSLGQGNLLSILVKDDMARERHLLEYINIQLRYTFAGQLGIVEVDLLKDVSKDEKRAPPLSRLKERRFQKNLITLASKIVPQLEREDEANYFVWLAQRYGGLRWIIGQRAQQQLEENDLSIEASSNYNGLLEVVANTDPALAKLAIKELVDICDPFAPAYFATKFQQQDFYCLYSSLSIEDRVIGVIKGEQMTPHRSTFATRRPNSNSPNTNNALVSSSPKPEQPSPQYYSLSPQARWTMVDSASSLEEMEKALVNASFIGLDTEWIPQFAHSGKSRTALVQIACDHDNVAFLLDVKTLLEPNHADLLLNAERILANMFADNGTVKLAYDFSGDLSLLRETLPRSKAWKIANMLDLKNVGVKGGLSGVVSKFLGVSMNKKQQLSNWEQRPLSLEQAQYAAGDSLCLLDIYAVLVAAKHPFVKATPIPPSSRFFEAIPLPQTMLTSKSDGVLEASFSCMSAIPQSPASPPH